MPTYSIVGPDGKTYSIDGPEGATREQVIRAVQARMGRIPAPYEPTETLVPPEPTRAPREEKPEDVGILGNLRKGLGAGFVSTGELAALGAATLLEEEEELAAREKIQGVADSLRPEGGDPDAFSYKLGSVLGSIGGTVVPAAAAAYVAPAGLATIAAGTLVGGGVGVGAGAGTASERARAFGATEEQRNVAALKGAGIGGLEAFLPLRLLTRGSKLGKLLEKADVAPETFREGLANAARTGGEEAVFEFAAAIAQDAVEKGYNPEKDIEFAQAIEEGGYGALGGAIVQTLADSVTKARKSRRRASIDDPDATDATDASPEQTILEELEAVDEAERVVSDEQQTVEGLSPLEREAIQAAERGDEATFESLVRRIELEREVNQAIEADDMDTFERASRELAFEERRAEDPTIDERRRYGPPEGPLASPIERARAEQRQETERVESEERRGTEQRRVELLQQTIEAEPDSDAKTISRKFKQRLSTEGIPDTAPTRTEMDSIRRAVDIARAEPRAQATPTPESAQTGAMEARIPEKRPRLKPDIITDARLNGLGIKPNSPLRKTVVGKDLNQPATRQKLQNFIESPRLARLDTKQAQANVARLLERAPEIPSDTLTPTIQGRGPTTAAGVRDARITESEQVSSRASVPSAVSTVGTESGVSSDGAGTEAVVAPEAGRVDDTGGRAGEPVRGKDAEPAPLTRRQRKRLRKQAAEQAEATTETGTQLVVEETTPGPGKKATTGKEVKTETTTPVTPAETKTEVKEEIEEVKEFGGFSIAKDAQTKAEIADTKEARSKKAAQEKEAKARVEAEKKAREAERKAAQDAKKKAAQDAKKAKGAGGAGPTLRDALNEDTRKELDAELEYAEEAEQLRAPRTYDIPDSDDPVTAADIKKIAAMIRIAVSRGTKAPRLAKEIKKYLGTPERVIDGIAEAIYEDVTNANNYRVPKGEDGTALDSRATREYMQGHSAKNARMVLKYLREFGSKKLNDWIDGRRARVQALENRQVTDIIRILKEQDVVKSTTTKISEKQIRQYVRGEIDDTTAEIIERAKEAEAASKQTAKEKAEQEAADEAIADERARIIDIGDIEAFDDSLPLELRTGATLDIELHPAAVAALKDGDLAGALAVLATSPNKDVARVAQRFAENIGKTKIELFSSKAKDSVSGTFDPKTNTVRLNTARGVNQHTLLHEVAHALTSATLANKSHPVTKQLNKLFDDVKDMIGTAYGAKNLDEFVSEVMSNPEFQAELAALNPNGSDVNALQRFFNTVGNFLRRLVGMRSKSIDSALTRADMLVNEILAPAPEYRDANSLAMASVRDDVKKIMNAVGDVQKSLGKNTGEKKRKFTDNLYDFMSSASDSGRVAALYFMDLQTLGDLSNRYSSKLGKIAREINTTIKESKGAQEQAREFVRERVERVDRWAKKNKKLVQRLNDVIYSQEYGATIYQVDPNRDRDEYVGKFDEDSGIELSKIWDAQRPDWEALGDDGQKVFNEMRQTYKEIYEKLKDVINGQIDDAVGKDSDAAKRMKKEVFAELFDRQRLEVYFPLAREGKYKLEFSYKPGKAPKGQDSYVFQMFESKAERDAIFKELMADKENIADVSRFDGDIAKQPFDKRPANGFVKDVLQVLDASNADAETKDQIVRLFIASLPETSFAKSLQKRGNVAGYDQNSVRVFNIKAYDLARQVEQLRYTSKLQSLSNQMYERDVQAKDDKDSTPLNVTRNALQGHINFAQRGAMFKGVEKFVRGATQFAFVYTIGGNVASTVVNLSQVPLVAFPWLGGKYGYADTSRELTAASKFVTGARKEREKPPEDATYAQKMSYIINSASIGYGIDSYYDIDDQGNMSVRRDLDNPELVQEAKRNLPLVQRAKKEAELTRSYLLDVLGMHEGSRAIKEGPAEAFTRRKDFVVATSAMMFNQAERYNRQTIMVASYNLALEQVSKDFPDMPFSERAELAADTAMYETQELAGGNILETSPRLGQQFLGRAALMYKQFGLRMYTTMFKSAYSAIKNSFLAAVRSGTPRKEAARDAYIAYKQLVGLHGSAYLFAGVYGLPLYGAASLTYKLLDEFGLRELFAEAFDDEDETFGSPEAYNDFDTIVRTHIGEGHFKGPLNVLLDDLGIGIDVASRVRLTGLLIQENKFNPDANFDEMVMYYAGGAPLSVGKRVANGFKMIGEGEIERGTELLMPAALANPLKALGRYAEAGRIENRRGNPIYDDLTSGEIAAQVFGFAPAEYIRITEENQNLVRIDKAMAAKKTKLLRQYYFAVSQGNYDDVIEARQKIQDFNDRNPSFALTQKSITTSLRKNLEADREMEQYNGVRLSPNMKRAIEMNRADAESTLIPPKETPK